MPHFYHIRRIQTPAEARRVTRLAIDGTLDEQNYTIVPLFRPSSKAGQALFDEEKSAILHVQSGIPVNILAVAEAETFKTLLEEIRKRMSSSEAVKMIRDSTVLVFWPNGEKSFAISNVPEDDEIEALGILAQIVEIISRNEPEFLLNLLGKKRKVLSIIKIEELKDLIKKVILNRLVG